MEIKKKEFFRDIIALGSIPFLILVLVRIYIVDNYNQMFQIILAVILIFIALLKVKKIDYHLAIMVVLAVFTSVFYKEWEYAIFVGLILISGVYGAKKYLKKENIVLSLFIGAVCSIISYLISIYLKIPNL